MYKISNNLSLYCVLKLYMIYFFYLIFLKLLFLYNVLFYLFWEGKNVQNESGLFYW